MDSFISACSGLAFPLSERISGELVRQPILVLIQQDFPGFTREDALAASELNEYRRRYLENFLVREVGELTELEETVLSNVHERRTLTDKVDEQEPPPTMGQRWADRIARFGGSWAFILLFFGVIMGWIGLNVVLLQAPSFDPYPFILLNLLLSCLAALQAPVIMMSQNRQEEKDRDRVKKDYMINLKAELELRVMHEKLDHLTRQQALATQHLAGLVQDALHGRNPAG
ncbi:DUF1003 domain-containing protein [Hymenobacter glacialis]|uniref:Cyclic nucleotide-binding protein n=1 Tax=Hymenobacter glacialis TaxID=1908236 RepID=A0A1G1T782_9BACT|nr:DUF1003 domain-containing protein [Hymenobacter glacialis]OGX86719.1 hypothetical protein BEN48_12355 [Hymenobacter glacialis]